MNTRKLKSDMTGVSPVIGVILMVAVTVVLAATVWVLVSNLSPGASNNDLKHMTISPSTHTTTTYGFTITTVDDNINYADITVKINGNATTFSHTGGLNVAAGDVLTVNGLTVNKQFEVSFIYQNDILASASVHT